MSMPDPPTPDEDLANSRMGRDLYDICERLAESVEREMMEKVLEGEAVPLRDWLSIAIAQGIEWGARYSARRDPAPIVAFYDALFAGNGPHQSAETRQAIVLQDIAVMER